MFPSQLFLASVEITSGIGRSSGGSGNSRLELSRGDQPVLHFDPLTTSVEGEVHRLKVSISVILKNRGLSFVHWLLFSPDRAFQQRISVCVCVPTYLWSLLLDSEDKREPQNP